jgi:hypothetical protein
VHPPSPPVWANFSIMDGMYARKWQLPLCVYSVGGTFSREKGRGAVWESTGCNILLGGEGGGGDVGRAKGLDRVKGGGHWVNTPPH